ncbi:MAG: rRNA maturation RNase YbeY [Ruminococcaceae bacterium]|nr:rRNA maturation RNase YbeY [Oscillospiraceae bacterium]
MIKFCFSCSYPDSRQYKAVIMEAATEALKYENCFENYEISITLTDDEQIHQYNKQFRNKDKATDVLSFPLSDQSEGLKKNPDNNCYMLGDIVISIDTAARQAKENLQSLEREIAFLTIHSVLHLLGYDHETSEEDEKEMFSKQDEIIHRIYAV